MVKVFKALREGGRWIRSCMNKRKLVVIEGKVHFVKCSSRAITYRQGWRFGKSGEPTVVKFRYYLCHDCLNDYLDAKAENEAEARMS